MACEEQHVPSNNRIVNSEDDSEEGSRQEDQMGLEEMSIMERMGPNSVDMTEEELETAFSQVAMAFRCDQYTLCQRLEAEEHARDRAEDNLKLEVKRGMEVLETLKGMCLDVKRAKLLQRLELCLSIIGSSIGRISSTAELLGAVHQEAKVSRGVELMLAHVENLKGRHERNRVELEEMKTQMEKSSRERQTYELREEFDIMDKFEKDSQKPHLRRRISVKAISKQGQRQNVKELQATSSFVTNENGEQIESNTNKPDQSDDCLLMDGRQVVFSADSPSQTVGMNTSEEASASAQTYPRQTFREETLPSYQSSSSLPALPRQRPRKKAALELSPAWLKTSERDLRDCDKCVISLQRPLLQWMYPCRWIIIVIYLSVLCSIIILAILVWFLQTPVLWM